MGYPPRKWSAPRKIGGRKERARAKSKRKKGRLSEGQLSKEREGPTSEEVVKRALNALNTLGSQKFALPPFSDYFNRWLMNLRRIISELESSSALKVDEQFKTECSQILDDIELKLQQGRLKEVSEENAIRNLSDAKEILEQLQREYVVKSKEFEVERDHEVERLSAEAEVIRMEVTQVRGTRTGLFSRILRKDKGQKDLEATTRLKSAEDELARAVESFNVEQQTLKNEYSKRKEPILEQIRNQEKEIESIPGQSQVDSSIEARLAACEALVDAVNALLQRNVSVHES